MADQPSETQTPTDQSASEYLDQFVGEDRKYPNVEELAKAYFHANGMIEHMKDEQSQLRSELDNSVKLKDVLNQQQQVQDTKPSPDPVSEDPAPITPAKDPQTESTDNDSPDLDAEIRRVLAEEDGKRVAQKNLDDITQRLNTTFDGDKDKIRELFGRKSAELGVSDEYLLEVAARSPKAFYDLMGVDAKGSESAGNPVPADINSVALENQRPNHNSGPKEGSYAYYEAMRRDNPTTYFSPRVQTEMMKQALAKGSDFYN